ncbi:hypothetical protein RMSM_02011 [Rhodopirellula maiorica SM1]|uniref:Uncharacterized protein n=1 Tax=Rhodopirellula maiorica SM1 TaxID=1265738 RepID=M5RP03_9BACT|nr:hypothetical protein RMSM_02011 [Rhodopirellula maiorica SM1]
MMRRIRERVALQTIRCDAGYLCRAGTGIVHPSHNVVSGTYPSLPRCCPPSSEGRYIEDKIG